MYFSSEAMQVKLLMSFISVSRRDTCPLNYML
jgi:hypothetical protein